MASDLRKLPYRLMSAFLVERKNIIRRIEFGSRMIILSKGLARKKHVQLKNKAKIYQKIVNQGAEMESEKKMEKLEDL